MKIQENIPISSLTTMRLGGMARYVAKIQEISDISEALEFARKQKLPVWFMGGGANTIGRDAGFPGLILLNQLKGIEVITETDDTLVVRGMGGEIWDDLVDFTVKKGFSGIEAMSMIPGTVGAAPVQNIGAYGQDLAGSLVEVEAYDAHEDKIVIIPKAEAAMTYRHTRFNFGEDAGRFFIISVTLRLTKNFLQPPFYTSLQDYVVRNHVTDYSPMNIRRMVCELRSEKLPDPAEVPSAGSFFKNIYVDQVEADEAEEKGIPVWRTNDDSGKINSGWLIENAGLKGKELHGFRVSDKAALILINESAKTYKELAEARQEIVDTVYEKYGFTLEQEPVEIPDEVEK